MWSPNSATILRISATRTFQLTKDHIVQSKAGVIVILFIMYANNISKEYNINSV